MESKLFKVLKNVYTDKIARKLAIELGLKPQSLQHYIQGREVRAKLLIDIRNKYGIKNNKKGLTDTQLLDLLEKDVNP